jgi:hypothetical protein
MKNLAPLLPLLALVALPARSSGGPTPTTQPLAHQDAAPPRPGTTNAGTTNAPNADPNTTIDAAFANQLVKVFADCQKIKPGMTRAQLIDLKLFDRDFGPLAPVDDKTFRQHTTFYYRSCGLIEVDIDFAPSNSKQERPTDIIAKVSMPYIDARPRR